MYGKLFESMFDGTLTSRGPWQALVTFQQMIILADPKGYVDMTPETIARRTTIPIEIIVKGIAALEKPDPDSRTPDEDGRRIVRLSDTRAWGWRIVNHGRYRQIRSQEERRKYMREYQRKRRSAGDVNQNVNNVNRSQPQSTDDTTGNQLQYAVGSTPLPPTDSGKARRRRQRLPQTPCPDSFEVTEELAAWAEEQGLPPDEVMPLTAEFLDFWKGDGRMKSDWLATWRNRVRDAVKRGARR